MKPEELQGLMKGIGIVIRDQLAPVFARMDALEKVQPLKGEDGESVTVDDVAPMLAELVSKAVAQIPVPKDGLSVDVEQVRSMVADEVKNIPPPKDGEDGIVDWLEVQELVNKAVANVPAPKDGKDADPVDHALIVAEVVKQIPVPKNGTDADPVDYEKVISEVVKRIPTPDAGKDGESVEFDAVVDAVTKRMPVFERPKDGNDGDSVTLDDVRPFIEAELSKWALDFERRAQGVLERAVDKIPAPKPGKDGIDGFKPDDFDVEHKDGGRVISYKFKTADREIVREHRTGMVIYRGVFTKKPDYQIGDSVTYGGSSWIAEKDSPTVPGEPNSGWRLAVKRGNDAK